MRRGAFGLGALTAPELADIDAVDIASGFYRTSPADGGQLPAFRGDGPT